MLSCSSHVTTQTSHNRSKPNVSTKVHIPREQHQHAFVLKSRHHTNKSQQIKTKRLHKSTHTTCADRHCPRHGTLTRDPAACAVKTNGRALTSGLQFQRPLRDDSPPAEGRDRTTKPRDKAGAAANHKGSSRTEGR